MSVPKEPTTVLKKPRVRTPRAVSPVPVRVDIAEMESHALVSQQVHCWLLSLLKSGRASNPWTSRSSKKPKDQLQPSFGLLSLCTRYYLSSFSFQLNTHVSERKNHLWSIVGQTPSLKINGRWAYFPDSKIDAGHSLIQLGYHLYIDQKADIWADRRHHKLSQSNVHTCCIKLRSLVHSPLIWFAFC